MVALAIPSEQQALADEVSKALDRQGDRPVQEVLGELGVASLLEDGGTLLDAAMVAEAAGRYGLVVYPDERILVAAACVGMAQRGIDLASAYACERMVFGRPIGEYQGISMPWPRRSRRSRGRACSSGARSPRAPKVCPMPPASMCKPGGGPPRRPHWPCARRSARSVAMA